MSKRSAPPSNFGIAEWYGRLYQALGEAERTTLLDVQSKQTPIACRFMHDTPALAPQSGLNCNKESGVCSIRNFVDTSGGNKYGPITSTCPFRFLESGLIVQAIGEALLGTTTPRIVKEVPFLKRGATRPRTEPTGSSSYDETRAGTRPGISREDVGKIDMVCVHPDREPLSWCAVEMQAVYFSGGKIQADFDVARIHRGNTVPLPGAKRRPDFRSSGPKRLMPQLQIKVPTLRRWGKKMAVVVDKMFFESLGPITSAGDQSNSDIAWVILDYEDRPLEGIAKLKLQEIRYCTLEDAVIGLTAGVPTTQSEFEERLRKRLGM